MLTACGSYERDLVLRLDYFIVRAIRRGHESARRAGSAVGRVVRVVHARPCSFDVRPGVNAVPPFQRGGEGENHLNDGKQTDRCLPERR